MARPKFLFLLLSVVAAVWLSRFFKIAQLLKMVAVDHPYDKELKIASLAVKRASVLTKGLSDSIVELSKSGTQIKMISRR